MLEREGRDARRDVQSGRTQHLRVCNALAVSELARTVYTSKFACACSARSHGFLPSESEWLPVGNVGAKKMPRLLMAHIGTRSEYRHLVEREAEYWLT